MKIPPYKILTADKSFRETERGRLVKLVWDQPDNLKTALIDSILYGHYDTAVCLLERGADPCLADMRGYGALMYCVGMPDFGVTGDATVLTKIGAGDGRKRSIQKQSDDTITEKVGADKRRILRYLVEQCGQDINALIGKQDERFTLLQWCIRLGRYDNLQFVLELGADPNVKSDADDLNIQISTLTMAAFNGDKKAVEVILQYSIVPFDLCNLFISYANSKKRNTQKMIFDYLLEQLTERVEDGVQGVFGVENSQKTLADWLTQHCSTSDHYEEDLARCQPQKTSQQLFL